MVTVQSDSNPNKFYYVTISSCTCPDFVYRQAKIGGKCKHMLKLFGVMKPKRLSNEVIEFFKDGVSCHEAFEKYGVKLDILLEHNLIVKVGVDKYYLL